MGCCFSGRYETDFSEQTLRAVLCATDLDVNAQLNSEFLALMSRSDRLEHESARLYMLAQEIIITAGLEADFIPVADRVRIAAALVAVERHLKP